MHQELQQQDLASRILLGGKFHFQQIRNGRVIDEWDAKNIIPNEGLTYILRSAISNETSAITAWYMGLKNNTAATSGSTYAAKVFTEETGYTETARPSWDEGGESSQSIDNSSSPADFSINTTVTIYGAFLCGGGTAPSTKGGSGGGSTLLCAADFSGGKSLNSGDTLRVTYTFGAQDDGA